MMCRAKPRPLCPAANLAGATPYTATVTTGVQSLTGNALASSHAWTFTTGRVITHPTVVSTFPGISAAGVAINGAINATFSVAMNAATIAAANFTLAAGAIPVSGIVAYDAPTKTATFTPASKLANTTLYTATVTTGVQDSGGNALASAYSWTFTTGTGVTPPTVIATVPGNSATGIAINGAITATFSVSMNASTIVAANFTVFAGATPAAGTVTYDVPSKTATFIPAGNLYDSTSYTATITTGAQDLAGNALAENHAWTFTTITIDLKPGALTPAAISVADGASLAIALTVNNLQPGPVSVPFNVDFHLALRSTFTPSTDLLIGTYTVSSGPAGNSSVPINTTVTIPPGSLNRDVYIYANVDPAGVIAETDKTNNVSTLASAGVVLGYDSGNSARTYNAMLETYSPSGSS